MTLPTAWRKTTQHLMPVRVADTGQDAVAGRYNIYPAHDLGAVRHPATGSHLGRHTVKFVDCHVQHSQAALGYTKPCQRAWQQGLEL